MTTCDKIIKLESSNKQKQVYLDGEEYIAELESMLPPLNDLDPNEMTSVALNVLTKGCTSYNDNHKKVMIYRNRYYFVDKDRHFMASLRRA